MGADVWLPVVLYVCAYDACELPRAPRATNTNKETQQHCQGVPGSQTGCVACGSGPNAQGPGRVCPPNTAQLLGPAVCHQLHRLFSCSKSSWPTSLPDTHGRSGTVAAAAVQYRQFGLAAAAAGPTAACWIEWVYLSEYMGSRRLKRTEQGLEP
jgi:hypothetical protein